MDHAQPENRLRGSRAISDTKGTPAFGNGEDGTEQCRRPQQGGKHRCISVFTHLLNHAIDGGFNASAFAEDVQSEGQRQGANDNATNVVGKHDSQAKDGQNGSKWNHDL